jgi:hypothetical protein
MIQEAPRMNGMTIAARREVTRFAENKPRLTDNEEDGSRKNERHTAR